MRIHFWQLILIPEQREQPHVGTHAHSVQASELIAKSGFSCHLAVETVTNGRKNVFMPLCNWYIDLSPFCTLYARIWEEFVLNATKPYKAANTSGDTLYWVYILFKYNHIYYAHNVQSLFKTVKSSNPTFFSFWYNNFCNRFEFFLVSSPTN